MTKTNSSIFMLPTLMFGVFSLLTMELGAMGLTPIIAEAFGVSVSDAGWVVSIFALIVAFTAPVTPLLAAKYNPQKVMLVCLAVFTLSSLAAAFVSNFLLLLILRAIPAFFHPIYCALAFSTAANSVAPHESIKATSKIFMAISAGMTLGIPLATYIASLSSLEFTFIFFALLNALAFVATLFFVKTPQNKAKIKSQKRQLYILAKPVIWLSIAAVIFSIGAMFGFYSYMSAFLLEVSKLNFALISFGLFVYGLSGVFGNYLAGKLLLNNPTKLLLALPCIMLVLYLLLFAFGSFGLLSLCILTILGVFAGILNSGTHFMLLEPAARAKEFANGLFISTANIGTTLGTIVCGLFISLEGMPFAVLGAVSFIILAFIVIYLRAKELYKK